MVTDPIKLYFEKRHKYQKISKLIPFFGLRADERRVTIQEWFPCCDGLEILDAGCGDGTLIESVINGTALRIRVEDLVSSAVKKASSKLIGKSVIVEGIVDNASRPADKSKYDLVLAIGIFDYCYDWPELLNSLLGRTRGELIVDFPKTNTIHTILRYLWLRVHGIQLQATNRHRLNRLFDSVGVNAKTIELSYNWISKICLD